MLELFEPLMWMAACWTCGIFTGLGLGAAIGRDQMDRHRRSELFEDRA
tara:strand:+ start:555 stop:698 length:144 start_codon:yes stop_codon:yes gene_type:complete